MLKIEPQTLEFVHELQARARESGFTGMRPAPRYCSFSATAASFTLAMPSHPTCYLCQQYFFLLERDICRTFPSVETLLVLPAAIMSAALTEATGDPLLHDSWIMRLNKNSMHISADASMLEMHGKYRHPSAVS